MAAAKNVTKKSWLRRIFYHPDSAPCTGWILFGCEANWLFDLRMARLLFLLIKSSDHQKYELSLLNFWKRTTELAS